MTDILCRWLNDEVHLEPKIVVADPTFTEKFSNGYLLGQILYKHDLQPDFCLFSKGETSEAKLNNFTRLEITFKLLCIPFNANVARDVMSGKPGAAVQLMYQLFMALNRKTERKMTAQSLECMKSPARTRLGRVETEIFQERLKYQTPRQVDLNFEELAAKFREQKKLYDEKLAKEKWEQEKRIFLTKMESCQHSMEYSRAMRERRSMMYAKLKPIESSQKRARSSPGIHSAQYQADPRNKSLAAETMRSIHVFEESLKKRLPSIGIVRSQSTSTIAEKAANPNVSGDYLKTLHDRVANTTQARMDRDKRRRKVLVEQMKALYEYEEVKREKMLVERLMKQCQQERRIATQLMHIRKEKDTIRNNRILRQQQLSAQKDQEFQQALDREAGLALLEEKEKKEQLRHHRKIYRRNMAEKAEKNYQMNYKMCNKIVLQIIDFATKMAHYRELTNNLVPAKIVRDWKTLFVTGRPLYEEAGLENSMDTAYTALSSSLTRSSVYADTSNEQLLNDTDFQEYKDATSEWVPMDGLSGSLPDAVNPILSHAVYRLLDTVDPPKPPPPPPHTPKFLLRSCIVGKPFTGKTSTLKHLSQAYGVVIVSIESVIKKAVEAYHSEKNSVDERKLSSTSNREELSNDVSGSENCTTPQGPLIPDSSVDLVVGSSGSVLLDTSEGEEKEGESDPKKERVSAEDGKIRTCDSAGDSVTVELSDDQLSLFTPMAVLGHKAYNAMAAGEAMDDGLMVDILVNELHSFPDGSGWILDNFPTTVAQAKLLSEALSVPSSPKPDIPRDFVLLAEQEGCHEKLKGACGLDIVLHFTATTEHVLERASHQDGSLPQSSYKLEQVQHRVLAYTENWPTLRRWYSKFKVVSHINANMELSSVYSAAAESMLQVMNKNKQADAMKKLGYEDVLSCGSVTSLASIASTSKSLTVKKSQSIHSPVSGHRPSSAESPCSTSKGRRRIVTKTPQSPLRHSLHPTPSSANKVTKEEWVPINLDIVPGSRGWEYFSQPISMAIAKGLARKWSNVEKTFITTLKQIFKILRGERECICQYFFIRRNEFSTYLCRPDHKQEFISQWQVRYNQLEPHLRCEEVMKAELHHRVDDLTDKLWDISERRKESSKEEQKRIADEKWLEDHTGLISNHFISIMQAELDRFQDTVLILKDYYASMGEKPPEKLPDLSRMALIDLPVTEPQDPPSSQVGSSQSVVPDSSSKQLQEEASPARDSVKRRVTLLPRQPPPDPMEDKTGKKKLSVTAPIPGLVEMQTGDLDQQLICYAYNSAVIAVAAMIQGEVKLLDIMISEAKKPPKPKTPPPPEPKEEKKGKKGKASPAAKKNTKIKTPPAGGKKGAAAAPVEPPPEIPTKPSMTPGEAMEKQRKIQACMEYKQGLLLEESRVKVRLELIRLKSIANITMLKSTNVAMHEEMDEWVKTCYDQEMESVNHLADILRQAIENEQKLLNEIVLPGAKFHIRESIIMFVPTPPPSPPLPVELPDPAYFTVDQLRHLHQQLYSAAPSGFLLVRMLVDTLQNMINRSSKDDLFPQLWRNASKQQIENMVDQLYGLDVNFVDWRRFLLCAAHPWPLPSPQDVLEAWDALVPERETVGRKTVSKEQFMSIEIWLDRPPELVEELEGEFNRNHALKDALFDIFCEGDKLDVKQMLLYLCADSYPKAGLFKALSLVTGSPLLPHQEVDGELTILLEDFHRVVTLGVHSDADTAAALSPSMEDLLEIFAEVDLSNPNQVSLSALLANKTGNELLYHSTGYSLLDLSALLRPLYGCAFTEGNNLTN